MKTKFMVLLLCLAWVLPVSAVAVGVDDSAAPPKVDLNRADTEELMELPGIGEKVAERIVEYRKANGPFSETRELMNVRGIGEKTFLKLEERLTVTKEELPRK